MVCRRQYNIILQLQFGSRVPLERREIHYQIVLDGKHAICRQVRVVFGEDLRRDGDVAVAADHQVDVGGAHGVAIEDG
jgi:hypothetical protein